MDAGTELMVENKVKEVLKTNNEVLLKDIGEMMNKISATSFSSNLNALETPKFKRKSNEEQFKYNSKVAVKLEQASGSLSSQKVDEAKENIIKALDMIKKRQKLVQLADSSELGWRMVAEYETNPIASDSDDEKKMYKAEARAARKVKSEKSKIRRGRAFPYRRQRQVPDTPSSSGVMQRNRRPGLCFTCGKPGHWKMECNQNSSNSNNKLGRSSSCMFCKCKDSKFDTNIEKLSVAGKKTSQNEMSDMQRRSTEGTVDGVYGSFDQSVSCANTSFNDTGHSSTDSINNHDTHCVKMFII
ncbi:uncharacterized protein LOC123538512 [Mercenaria mercenaria]|uniref:uncharacterized protein LOC123538512 n=1 Tax=Mercenaria mercenaria TaxID=6596 RepID=UPI00234FA937|nr:uncharacterized protein LOC123538512 [Mercenaria mercenaria]